MKVINNYFNRKILIGITIIIIFTMIGFSYCEWNDILAFNCNLKSGQLELIKDNEKSSYYINLNDNCNDFIIPFNIKNNSTMPVKEKSISCYIYDIDITEACNVVFSEYENNEIKGNITLDLDKIDKIIIEKEVKDYSLIVKPLDITEVLNVKMEFIQANVDKGGWDEFIDFDIYINKTIMPIIPEVVTEVICETVPIINYENNIEEVIVEDLKTEETEVLLELKELETEDTENDKVLVETETEETESTFTEEQQSAEKTIIDSESEEIKNE